MKLGWFGAGSGALADAAGVADVAVVAERLGYESIWIGEHPVLIDPHEPPSPLPSHSELLDLVPALAFAAAHVDDPPRHRHRHPPAPQPGDVRQGDGLGRRALRRPRRRGDRGRVRARRVRGHGLRLPRRGRRADECVDALRTLWESGALRSPASTSRSRASSAARNPGSGHPDPRQRHVDGGLPPCRRPLPGLVRVLPHRRAHPRRPRGAGACTTRWIAPSSWASSRSPSPRRRWRSTPTRREPTRTSACTGWCPCVRSRTWRCAEHQDADR